METNGREHLVSRRIRSITFFVLVALALSFAVSIFDESYYAKAQSSESEIKQQMEAVKQLLGEKGITYFTANGKKCTHTSDKGCPNCQLYSIMPGVTSPLYTGPQIYAKTDKEAGTCVAYAWWLFYNLFEDSPDKAGSVNISNARAGDYVNFGGHAGIFYKWANNEKTAFYCYDGNHSMDCKIHYADLVFYTSNVKSVKRSSKDVRTIGKRTLNISASGGTATGAGQYKPGTTVTVSATADEYHSFVNWSSSVDGIPANTNSSTTTITMPESDVTLTANFKLKMGTVLQSWESISASATKNNASLSATLSVEASTLGFGITYPATVSNVFLVISPDSNIGSQAAAAITGSLGSINAKGLYFKQFDVPTATSTNISGGKRYKYAFSITSINQLKNSSGTVLTLSPSTTYYYSWMATVNDKTIHTDVKSFTTNAAGTQWGTPSIDSNGYFYDWVYYNKSSLSVPEVGIFVGTDENVIKNIKTSDSVPNGVEKRIDQGNIDSAYNSSKGATYIFYKPAGFTKITFNPGVSYFYKFYSIDADGDVVYSTVARRDIPGTVATYSLTINAGSGGKITTGTSGTYAAGNVVGLLATPLAGYTFKSWSITAGSVASPTNASTSYTMPSQTAIVTAYFQPIDYTLTASALDGGTVTASKTSGLHYCDTVTLTATPNTGYTFKGWISDNGGTFSNNNSATTTFTMPVGNVNIYADFVKTEYSISISADYGNVIVSCDSAIMGTTVSLNAVDNNSSRFVRWQSNDVSFNDSTSQNTSFVMPAKKVRIEAVFELYNLYDQRDASLTMMLPEDVEIIQSDAFTGTRARYFVLSESVKQIEANAFPNGSTVYLMDAGRTQIDANAIPGNGTYVEMSGDYDFSFASRVQETTNHYCFSNGTIPEEWSAWSEWSDVPVTASSDTEVETKTQYRSASVTYSDSYSAWSDWSSWSYTRQSISNSVLKEERTRQVYPYYYFVCPNCGGHSAYWGSRTCDLCGKSVNILESSFDIDIDNISVSKSECSKLNSSKYYTVFNGQRYFYWDDGSSPSQQTIKTQYSYRTRTVNSIPNIGAYGDWRDGFIQETTTVSVQTRTVYRYRTRE